MQTLELLVAEHRIKINQFAHRTVDLNYSISDLRGYLTLAGGANDILPAAIRSFPPGQRSVTDDVK